MTKIRAKPARSFDGILSRGDLRRLLLQKLWDLKAKILKTREEVLTGREFLGAGKRFLFGLGLILPKDWRKTLSVFVLGSLVLTGMFGGLQVLHSGAKLSKQILGTATTGLEFLQSGDVAQVSLETLDQLKADLENAQERFGKILETLPAGQELTALPEAMSRLAAALNFAKLGLREFADGRLVWDEVSNSSNQELFYRFKASRGYLLKSEENLSATLAILQKLDPGRFLPPEVSPGFTAALEKLKAAHRATSDLASAESLILNLLGGEPKTYLLVFQNNNEARATGGFIGTYGLLDFANGRVRLRQIESIYALDGQLEDRIAPPGPLQRQVTNLWALRDSNWFVDFPQSARKMLDFLDKEAGILADGVIALTPDLLEKLLTVTGPVAMPEYQVTLSAENFREAVQYKTSFDYDRRLNQSKKFLADFTPRFFRKLEGLSSAEWFEVFKIFFLMVSQKQVLLFSLDPKLQAEIRNRQADGGIWPTDGDYLAIYHSNVGGGKTDQKILQKVEKQVKVVSGGLAVVRLKITRGHYGFDEKYFPKNLDYMRILVPARAKLLSASGFDDFRLLPSVQERALTDQDLARWDAAIERDQKTQMYVGEEAGYRVFSNWLELLPGQTKTVELGYELPLERGSGYTHLLQKQPGAVPFEFTLEIDYLSGNIVNYYPPSFSQTGNRLRLTETVSTDRFYGVVAQ